MTSRIAISESPDAAQIRRLMADRVEAVRAKDVNASMSAMVPDILSLIHEHYSVPFHVESGKASLNLKPWLSGELIGGGLQI